MRRIFHGLVDVHPTFLFFFFNFSPLCEIFFTVHLTAFERKHFWDTFFGVYCVEYTSLILRGICGTPNLRSLRPPTLSVRYAGFRILTKVLDRR